MFCQSFVYSSLTLTLSLSLSLSLSLLPDFVAVLDLNTQLFAISKATFATPASPFLALFDINNESVATTVL